MSFLKKIFGMKKKDPSGLAFSLYQAAQGGNIPMFSKRCGICGKTFPCPGKVLDIATRYLEIWTLDVGGYCPTCQKYVCSKHAKFINNDHAHPDPNQTGEALCWRVGCSICGSMFEAEMRLRLSVLTQLLNVTLSSQHCDVCSTSFQLPQRNMVPSNNKDQVKEKNLTISSFILDVGGYCSGCRKNLCPTHLKLKEIVVGNDVLWMLCCTRCGTNLS